MLERCKRWTRVNVLLGHIGNYYTARMKSYTSVACSNEHRQSNVVHVVYVTNATGFLSQEVINGVICNTFKILLIMQGSLI